MSLSFAGFHLEIAFDPTLHIAVLRPERGDDFLLRNLRKGTSVFTVPDAFIASPVVLVKQRTHFCQIQGSSGRTYRKAIY